MKHINTVAFVVAVVVVFSLCLVQAQPGPGGGGGGNGGRPGNNNGGGNSNSRGGCRRWEIPSICRRGEHSHFDNDGCINCIDLSGDIIDGCSLIDIAKCALDWRDLPVCASGEWPSRDNDTCCFNCRPGLIDRCTVGEIARCARSYIGSEHSNKSLPVCSDGEEPQYNSSTCCSTCRPQLFANMTSSNGDCTLDKFRTCTSSMPVCEYNEEPIFDGDACCGSCRRPPRTCDIASVVRCYTSAPLCEDDDVPTWVSGECCPSCIFAPLPNSNCTNCSADNDICVRDYDTTNGTYTPVCATRTDLNFTLTASGVMIDIFKLLNARHIRHLVNEYIRRYCDKANNKDQCSQYAGSIRDMVISVTLECSGVNGTNGTDQTIRVNGGDQRCNGRWGADGDGDEYEWFNSSVVADPDLCTIRVLISIATGSTTTTNSSTNSTTSSSSTTAFTARPFVSRTLASSSTPTPGEMVQSALSSDQETLGDGLQANFGSTSSMSAAARLIISPFILFVTMTAALLA